MRSLVPGGVMSACTRRLFQRDAAGHVVGYINRRDGVDFVLKKYPSRSRHGVIFQRSP